MHAWINIFTSIHIAVYRFTHGILGSKLGRQSILLLHSTGARTGRMRITTLSYCRDGERYLVVASNWGRPNHPGWYHNLLANPHATIQVKSHIISVQAHLAQADEYLRLWQLVTEQNDQYIRYQRGLARRIPIIILTPHE